MRPNRRARENRRQAATSSPLVLVENEATEGGRYDHWQDVTGERYQFPNQYKGKILSGRQFIYYRGSRRAGGVRATPEYFGYGVIGQVEIDSNTNRSRRTVERKWICTIEDYVPFPRAVPFKVGSVRFEKIPDNLWGIVRDIPSTTYKRILRHAGIPTVNLQALQPVVSNLPDLSLVSPRPAKSPLMIPTGVNSRQGVSKGGTGVLRRTPHSTIYGHRGEEVALKHLTSTLDTQALRTLRWVSNEGSTPGWDIEYRSIKGNVFVEVKASSSPVFLNLELTANEWAAAQRHRKRYILLLVTNVTTRHPEIEPIVDPFGLVETGEFDSVSTPDVNRPLADLAGRNCDFWTTFPTSKLAQTES